MVDDRIIVHYCHLLELLMHCNVNFSLRGRTFPSLLRTSEVNPANNNLFYSSFNKKTNKQKTILEYCLCTLKKNCFSMSDFFLLKFYKTFLFTCFHFFTLFMSQHSLNWHSRTGSTAGELNGASRATKQPPAGHACASFCSNYQNETPRRGHEGAMCGDLCLEPRTVQLNQNSAKNSRTKKKMHKCFSLFYFHWVIICGLFTYSKDDDITRSGSLLELWSKKVWNLLMRKTQVYINLQNAVNSTGYRKETRKIEFFNIHVRKELYIMFQARSISCVRFHRGL